LGCQEKPEPCWTSLMELREVGPVNGPLRQKGSLTKSSLVFYKHWSQKGNFAYRRLLGSLHEAESELNIAPYLRVRGSNAHVFLQLRTGSLWFNDRVSKFVKERTSACMSCFDANRHTATKETLEHFLIECPRYREERESWATGWLCPYDSLFSHGPLQVSAALGESVQFFGGVDSSEFQKCRMLSIRSMWNKRCAILAQSLPPLPQTLIPGVNAD
jgi:hypothetical protein